MIGSLIWYVFAAMAVGAACTVAFSRNVVHCGFGLLFTLLGVCAMYAFLGADFLMATQVILRFGFSAPQAWAEEVDRYLFVWSAYLGTVVAWLKGTHIRVTFVVELLGDRAEALSLALTRV